MDRSEFSHESVLLHEAVDALFIREGGIYVDCTTGGAGHSERIARHEGVKRLICIDQDEEAIQAAKARLSFSDKVIFIQDNFKNIKELLAGLGIQKVDGLLYDLGVSSHQIDTPGRGFSYSNDAPLDMRMSKDNPFTAKEVVNTYERSELIRIFREYGEEKYAREIASKIVRRREEKEVGSTGELSEIIQSALPPRARYEGGHPAKRVFQAIRIEVNRELAVLPQAISDGIEVLSPGGRIVVITFHSLEDRIVKTVYNSYASGCTCPRDFPVCVCGKKPEIRLLGKKAITPSAEELLRNKRAKSARLRAAQKI